MLFSYPIEATQVNWLHECLQEAIGKGMAAVDAGEVLSAWPAYIDAAHRDRLSTLGVFGSRFDDFLAAYSSLGAVERQSVSEAIEDQNALNDLYLGERTAATRQNLPEAIREPSKVLFDSAFDALKATGIRDENYRIFIDKVNEQICAFCGCEHFNGAGSKREPLDHYLALSLYPFSGSNMKNLLPMGSKCNSSYKLAQDILRENGGLRRVCFDPFDCAPVSVNLDGTTLLSRPRGLPTWSVNIVGDAERISTWDSVFSVRRRYIDDHLDSIYKNSLKVVGKTIGLLGDGGDLPARLANAFSHLLDISLAEEWADRAFLKAALYKHLHDICANSTPELPKVLQVYGAATLADA